VYHKFEMHWVPMPHGPEAVRLLIYRPLMTMFEFRSGPGTTSNGLLAS